MDSQPAEVKIDDLDGDDMPPLETIDDTKTTLVPNNDSGKSKNIVIPETDDKKNVSDDDNDDENDNDDDQPNKDGYTDILNNGDLRKKVIKKGDPNIRPQRGSKVVISLQTRLYAGDDQENVGKGELIQAETFDRFELNLGDNDLHQGLDLMIPLMELNEVCRAIIKPRFAYGPKGNQSIGIPENATLDCLIELLEIPDQNDDILGEEDETPDSIPNKESLDDRLKIGNYKKTRGNFWYERGEYSLAIQCYRGALKYFDASQSELKLIDQKSSGEKSKESVAKIEDLIEKRALTFNNLAAAQMGLEAFDSAMRSLNDSLLLRPDNFKALFRRAKIQTQKGNIEEAIEDLKKAAKINPQSESIALELERLNKILAKQLKEQKELYRRMVQGKQSNDQTKSKDTTISSATDRKRNQTQSKWSRWFGWPVLSLGIVTAGAIAIQLLYTAAK